MPKQSLVKLTRVIISKEGKIKLENKTNPHVHFRVKVDMELELFCNGGETVNLHRLNRDQMKLVYRRQYLANVKDKDTDQIRKVKRWTTWEEYPKSQIVFQRV